MIKTKLPVLIIRDVVLFPYSEIKLEINKKVIPSFLFIYLFFVYLIILF